MKKITQIVALLLLFQTGFARTLPFIISGKWERSDHITEITLFKVVYGRLEKVSVGLLKEDHSFAIAYVPVTEGFFVIGFGNPNERKGKYTFYFKPGDNLYFVANDRYYTLEGENTRENIVLKSWHDHVSNFREDSTKQFQTIRTGNKIFDEQFAKYRKFNVMENRGISPDYDLTTNTELLMFPYGINLLKKSLADKVTIEDAIDATHNDTLKGEVFLYMLADVKQLSEFKDLAQRYSKYILTKDQQIRFDQEIERVNRLHIEKGVGVSGLDFTYKDVDGNDVSFSDLKGKVVYMTVWATWCGPCVAELPHKKKLETHFSGNNNIVFVSVSTDHLRDIQRWKDFVVNHDLRFKGAIQLSGNIDGPTNIHRLYGITGIPRYLLFDKEGNIVSIDAPRPSSPEVIPMLNRLLRR
ncbi:MAG: TlpA family protein disulfide reductase [Bacteroidales bacterium]|nr:TlpA family protein disulfide reductase [Bacteroidales bacterium]